MAAQAVAIVILSVSGLWLIAVGAMMAVRPERCLHILSLTASTHQINLTEQGFRMIAGMAMVVRADLSRLPVLFEIGGFFIVISSLLLMVIPLRWHAGYAIWWAKRFPLWSVRVVAPLSICSGIALIYCAI